MQITTIFKDNISKLPNDASLLVVIDAFYIALKVYLSSNTEMLIDYQWIALFWEEYVNNLAAPLKNKVHPFSHLIVAIPQELPQDFDTYDIAQAAFFLSLPDILLEKKLNLSLRNDLYSSIIFNKKNEKIILSSGKEKRTSNPEFENFVIKTEIERGENSIFFSLKAYLQEQSQLDRYTQREFSQLFLATISNQLYTFLRQDKIQELVEKDLFSPIQCIKLFHEFFVRYLLCYVKYSPEKEAEENINPTDFTLNYRGAQESRHLNRLLLIANDLSDLQEKNLDEAFNLYLTRINRNIDLDFFPCSSEEEKKLQNRLEIEDLNIREALSSPDVTSHNMAKEFLGLPEETLNLRPFICMPFSFPKEAFENVSLEKPLLSKHIYIMGIEYLSYLDKDRNLPLYFKGIENLHNAFFNNPNWRIKNHPSDLEANNKSLVLQNIQLLCFSPTEDIFGPVKFLLWETKENQQQLTRLCEFLRKQSLERERYPLSEAETLMLIYLQDEINDLHKEPSITAIQNIIYCRHLPLAYRLVFSAIIADEKKEQKRIYLSEAKTKFFQTLSMFINLESTSSWEDIVHIMKTDANSTIAIVADVINQLSQATCLSKLIDNYYRAYHNNHSARWMQARAQSLFSDEKREELKENLMRFSSKLKKSESFFPNIIQDNALQKIIEKINSGEYIITILADLKELASKKRNNSAYPNLEELYIALNDFFNSPPCLAEELLNLPIWKEHSISCEKK